MLNWVWGGNASDISSMCTSSLNTAMASDRAAAVICNRCAVVCFLPTTWRELHCVRCNLTAELD